MFKEFKIRTKLTAAFLGVVIFSVSIAGYLSYRIAENEISDQVSNELILAVGIKERQIAVFLENLAGRAVDFASDGFIRDSAQKIISGQNAQMVSLLNNHLSKNKMSLDETIQGIAILDLSGRVIASSDEKELGADESRYSYFMIAARMNYGEPYLDSVDLSHHFGEKTPVMAVSAPLFDNKQESRLGVLVNFVKLDELSRIVSGREFLKIAQNPFFKERRALFDFYLVDRDNLIMTEIPASKELLTQKADIEPARKCARKEHFVGRYNNYSGEPVIGASACLENGWTLVEEISEKNAFKGIADIRRVIFAASVFIIAGLFVVVYFLAKGIIKPVANLALAADIIGRGRLDFRAQKEANDEIGELADAFNAMAAKLKKSYVGLEEKIKERTSDLEKFRLAVENSTNHVVITDPEGVVIYANKAAEETTGFSRKSMLGRKAGVEWGKLMDATFYQKMWRTIKAEKKVFSGEITNRRKSGEKYEAFLNVVPLLDESGAVKFFVGIERDITEEKRIDRAKTEFVSLASHQLRTPLATIKWYVERLLSEETGRCNKKQKQYMSEVYRSNQRMINLVSALLNVSRIEMGTLKIAPEPTVLKKVSQGEISELLPQIEKKKLKVEENYDEQIPLVNVDPDLTRIIFQNLLSNSVKYTPEKGKITVEIKRQMKDVLIKVSDTGIGIPLSQQSKIFEKFARGDNAKETDPDGTGLGLYIVKSVVDQTGGKVWFESKENAGTTFFVTIPLEGTKKKTGTKKLEE